MSNACAITVSGYHTDIAITVYSNCIFLIVSHFKKLGSIVKVVRESPLTLDQYNSNIFSTKVLFGKDEEEVHAAARYIAENIQTDRPLLLSICLKDYDIEILKAITNAINQLKTW